MRLRETVFSRLHVTGIEMASASCYNSRVCPDGRFSGGREPPAGAVGPCEESLRRESEFLVKFNWDQSGMPVSLVSRMGLRNEFSEFKSVLSDAQNQVLTPVDAESMARELVESGGRDFVEMVRELTTTLANVRKDLKAANRRYERLASSLARRGIRLDDDEPMPAAASDAPPVQNTPSVADRQAEWDEWNLRFQSLLG